MGQVFSTADGTLHVKVQVQGTPSIRGVGGLTQNLSLSSGEIRVLHAPHVGSL